MDFLDPQKQKRHARRLILGYILIGLTLVLATVILLYQVFGFSIDRQGRIFQNGLVYISSLPDGSQVYVDGESKDTKTNTRLVLPAGQYVFELKRDGYRTWKRAITVEGGTVQRFEYPILFPDTVQPSVVKQYSASPSLMTQSIDHRWVLAQSGTPDSFDLYDLDASEPTPQAYTIPVEVLSADTTTTGWQEVEWSKDNKHVVLRRLFIGIDQQPSSEYVLLDRENANASVNLSVTLGFTPTVLQLRDQNYDQYFALDQSNGLLFTASLNEPTPQPYLSDVLSFRASGSNDVLYATSKDAPAGKTLIRIREGEDKYTIRQVASDAAPYLLDLSRYDGSWYVAAGASGEDKVYVYKNPIDSLKSNSGDVLVPVNILKATHPTYLSFGPESRFVLTEGGQEFAVYDAKNNKGYAYTIDEAIDSVLSHVVWMNEYHLMSSSAAQTLVFDYDGTNQQLLSPIAPTTLPVFDRDYRKLYTLTSTAAFTSTVLRP